MSRNINNPKSYQPQAAFGRLWLIWRNVVFMAFTEK